MYVDKRILLLIGILVISLIPFITTTEAACGDCVRGGSLCSDSHVLGCQDVFGDGTCYDWEFVATESNFCPNGCENIGSGIARCKEPPTSCSHQCEIGQGYCEGNTQIPCRVDEFTGCRKWATDPKNQNFCKPPQKCEQSGYSAQCTTPDPDPTCSDSCIEGAFRCGTPPGIIGDNKYRIPCGNFDEDECLEYADDSSVFVSVNVEYCDFGCDDIGTGIAECRENPVNCENQCNPGHVQCDAYSGVLMNCDDYNLDGCNEYQNPVGDTTNVTICSNGCQNIGTGLAVCKELNLTQGELIRLEQPYTGSTFSGIDVDESGIWVKDHYTERKFTHYQLDLRAGDIIRYFFNGTINYRFNTSYNQTVDVFDTFAVYAGGQDVYADQQVRAIGSSLGLNANNTALFSLDGTFVTASNFSTAYTDIILSSKDEIRNEWWIMYCFQSASFGRNNCNSTSTRIALLNSTLQGIANVTNGFEGANQHQIQGLSWYNDRLYVMFNVLDPADEAGTGWIENDFNQLLVKYRVNSSNRSQLLQETVLNLTEKLGLKLYWYDFDIFEGNIYFLTDSMSYIEQTNLKITTANANQPTGGDENIYKFNLDELTSDNECDASLLSSGNVDSKCSGDYPNSYAILCNDDDGDGDFEWSQNPAFQTSCGANAICTFQNDTAQCTPVVTTSDGVCPFTSLGGFEGECQLGTSRCVVDRFTQNCIEAPYDPDCAIWNTSTTTCGGEGTCVQGACVQCSDECTIGATRCEEIPIATSIGGGVITSHFIVPCTNNANFFTSQCTIWGEIGNPDLAITECEYGCKLSWNNSINDTQANCILPDNLVTEARNNIDNYRASLNVILEGQWMKMIAVMFITGIFMIVFFLLTGSTEIGLFVGLVGILMGILFGWLPIIFTVFLILLAAFIVMRWLFGGEG